MSKTINTILSLTDKFTPKLTAAQKEALIFKTQLKNSTKAADSIDKALSKAASTALAFGTAASAAAAGFAASAVNTYKDFESSMSNVAGILGVSQNSAEYEALENAAREAGKTTTKSAQEAADALSYMALAGWSTQDSIKSLEPILRASEATGADLATTSDLITDSMSALGLSVDELQRYLDVCARAQNKSNTTLTQMQEAYIGVGGTFKNFGTGLQESGALLGVLANRGIKGAEAGTRLQSTLVNLTKQSGESYKAMQALGVSAYDANGDFKGITNVLEEVNQATAGLTEEERNNYLTMIAGKTQLTTLNALMSGLTNTLEDGTNEYQALYDSLGDCDGALDQMADTMTDNLSGSLALAQSAFQDLQIEIGEKLAPYVNQAIQWFAENLPEATEKLAVWLDNKIPKAVDFCKSALEKLKPVVTFFMDNFAEIATAAATAAVGLKALSTAFKISSVAAKFKTTLTGLTTAQKLATIAQTALNTSILACPITWVVAGITAVTAAFLAYEEHMKKADLAAHFGDITLSAEECTALIRDVFGSDLMNQIDDVASAYEDVQSSIEAINSSAKKLNKLNFKLDYGGNVSAEDYKTAADDYIADLQDLMDNEQHSINLSVDLLFGDDENGDAIKTAVDNLYNGDGGLNSQFATESQALTSYLQEAIENGLEIDPAVVREQFAKLEEIKNQIAIDESTAKLQALQYDFTMGDLSEESFKNMLESAKTESESMLETYNNARIQSLAGLNAAYNSENNTMSEADYSAAVQAINDQYYQDAAGVSQKVLDFGAEAIKSAYPDVFDGLDKTFDRVIADTSLSESDKIASMNNYLNSNVSSASRKNIWDFFQYLSPTMEELGGYMNNMGEEQAQSYMGSLINAMTVQGVGSTSLGGAVKLALKSALSSAANESEEAAQPLQDFATNLPSTIQSAMESDLPSAILAGQDPAIGAVDTVKGAITDEFELPIDVNVPVNVTFDVNTGSGLPSIEEAAGLDGIGFNMFYNRFNTDANATGTTYFGGGFTRINENGGEIVDLPTGTRIIPADKSKKMANNSGGVNISMPIYIQGNIFGEEEAAEIIGNKAFEKLYDLVAAM